MVFATKYSVGDKVYVIEGYNSIKQITIDSVEVYCDRDECFIIYGEDEKYSEKECFDNILDAEKKLKEKQERYEESKQ